MKYGEMLNMIKKQNMEFEKKIDSSFSKAKQEFPFDNYINISVYHEMRAVLRQLRNALPEFTHKQLLDIGCDPRLDKIVKLIT